MDDPDAIVADVDIGPSRSRTKTRETVKPGHRIELDLDDPDALADFLIEIGKHIRLRRRIVIIIE